MPVYKDEQRGTWFASFYYTNWQGERKLKKKRGFKTQREAKAFEREFQLQHASDPNMTFESLYELYEQDAKTRLRETTMETKLNMINTHILPYFKTMKIADITPGDIRRWQNQMLEKENPRAKEKYAPTYLRSINAQLAAIFNFAVQYYNLQKSPCQYVKAIGKQNAGEMLFWTVDEFNKAMEYELKPAFHLCFMILFWCGLRQGEALALTPEKIIHDKKALDIFETYHNSKGQESFGPTKTDNSVRKVLMPDFVYDELIDYTNKVYGMGEKDRIFYFTKTALNNELNRLAALSGVKRIRVHDLRHSHVALLIKLGYRTHAIAERIGDSYETVERTYAHLYPDVPNEMIKALNKSQFGITDTEQNNEI